MDEKSLGDLLSKWMDHQSESSAAGEAGSGEGGDALLHSLMAAAGLANGAASAEVERFLRGEGELLETTRAAMAGGGSSAVTQVAEFLESRFHLSAPIARMIATALVKQFPVIAHLTGGTVEKPKPHSTHKPKPSASHKPAAHKPKPSSSHTTATHKPKPHASAQPAAEHKPKPHAAKPAASSKPKPHGSAKPAASHKPKPPAKKGTRTEGVEIPGSGEES